MLFDDARQLTAQKKFAEACPKLQESWNLDPAIGTKFYLAECYESIGKLASAWSCYLEVAEDAHKQGSADREKFANERAAALKPRLPRLTVAVAPATRGTAGLSVKRNGVPVGEGAWDTAMPVDLGDHLITASAPGKKAWETHVEAKQEGAPVRVEIPVLEAEVTAGPVKLPPEKSNHDEPEAPPTPRWATHQGTAGIVIGSVGILGLGGGIIAGIVALNDQHTSNGAGGCTTGDICSGQGQAVRYEAIHAATASTVLFVAGGAMVAGGGILLLTAPSGKAKTADAPTVGIGPGSILVGGHF